MADEFADLGRIAFLSVACLGAAYFLFAKRHFDFCAISFFSGCFYFLPGFVGFTGYPRDFLLTPVPLESKTYSIMACVLASTLLAALARDFLRRPDDAVIATDDRLWFTGLAATCAAVGGFLLTLLTTGSALWDPDKFELMDALDRWHLLWTTGAVLGFAIAYLRGSRPLLFVNLCLLVANLYVGFRVDLVIAVLVVLTLVLRRPGVTRLAKHWRTGLVVCAFGAFLFAYKYLLFAIKSLDLQLLISQLRNPEVFYLMFLYSEPFVIHGILNEVVRQDYAVTADHLSSLPLLLIPFANEFGAEFVGFNDLFQPALFSSVTGYGLGSNVWAEMTAVGGWSAVVCLCVIFGASLVAADLALKRAGPELAALVTTISVYWAFYAYRNDLLYQLTLTRRIVLAWVAFAVLGLALAALMRRFNSLAERLSSLQGTRI